MRVNVCTCVYAWHFLPHTAVEANDSCKLGQQKENAKPLREHLHTQTNQFHRFSYTLETSISDCHQTQLDNCISNSPNQINHAQRPRQRKSDKDKCSLPKL